MPELPDIQVYVEHLAEKFVGEKLLRARIATPFLVRTFDPPLRIAEKKRVVGVRRMGKRIVFALEDDLFIVIHLMIAGRFRVRPPGAAIPGRLGLAAFDFSTATLLLTEAGTKRRASLHVVRGEPALRALDPGGLDPFEIERSEFAAALIRERHTLKRTLTDPRILSGIGNAYSDEILHRARLSPAKMTTQLTPGEIETLFDAARTTLREWTARLREATVGVFPEHVTAFHDEMAVHGKYNKPCPVCASPVQRIRYADNESNYCARCQTGDKLLVDRSLSRLLKTDWPKTLDELGELEARKTTFKKRR